MALYAFDGTWNSADKQDEKTQELLTTNVHSFWEAYDTSPDRKVYKAGVGTRMGTIGSILGGGFGAGAKRRLREMYHELAKNYAKGDHDIDIIGFSRGAALALQFANVIDEYGVPDGTKRKWTPQRLRLLGWTRRYKKYHKQPKIRFLGIWDAVPSFGIPIDAGPFKFNKINLGYEFDVPKCVEACHHAVSLDELRESFRPTRTPGEVWFRGVHSNVGGGYADRRLSDIALGWMFKKAKKAGLPLDGAKVAAIKDWKENIKGDLGEPQDPKVDPPRKVEPGAFVHPSVLSEEAGQRKWKRPLPEGVRAEPES